MRISNGGVGSSHVDKKILNVNIIDFQKLGEGGGGWKMWIRVLDEFRDFLILFLLFYYISISI